MDIYIIVPPNNFKYSKKKRIRKKQRKKYTESIYKNCHFTGYENNIRGIRSQYIYEIEID